MSTDAKPPALAAAKLKLLTERLKEVHWMWWMIWLASVLLLGLVIIRHPTREMHELAPPFRSTTINGLLPVHIILHRGLGKMAGYTLAISVVLVVAGLSRPQTVRLGIQLAVGLVLLFFALYTMCYSRLMTQRIRADARQLEAGP